MSSVHANVAIAPEKLDAVQAGTVFTKTAIGWDVKWVDGGTVVFLQGATIIEALGSHGAQVVHPVKEVPEGIVEVDRDEPVVEVRTIGDGGFEAVSVDTGRRDPDQDAAIEAAFAAGVLPEEDRRDEGAE